MKERAEIRDDDARRAPLRIGGPSTDPHHDELSVPDSRTHYYRDADSERRWLIPPDPHQPLRARWDPTVIDEDGRRPARPDRKKQSRLGRFVSTYGWRAYALPVLTAITVVIAADAIRGTDSIHAALLSVNGTAAQQDEPTQGPRVREPGTGIIGVPPKDDGRFAMSSVTGVLPPGGPFTSAGRGVWHLVRGTTGQVGKGSERVFTYTVEVEDGVDSASFGGDDAFAAMVDQTLANPKSWIKDPRMAFRRIDAGKPSFRVSLTSQRTTHAVCGFDIPIDTSCFDTDTGRVVLDGARWVRGALPFQGDIGSYRQYLVNHEIGHAVGYHQHQPCQIDGGLAPVMMQQTFGTADNDIARLDPAGVVPSDGKACHYNPWPYPRG